MGNGQFLGANGELATACMKSSGLDVMETVMKAVAGFSSKALFSVPVSALFLGRRTLADKLG